jgi:exosome complex protein LRP1
MDPGATDVLALVDQLDDEIDDLEEALAPVLDNKLADTASRLPVLDKAKLYILTTYAVESILFCKPALNQHWTT